MFQGQNYTIRLFRWRSPAAGGKSCCEPMPDDVRPPPGRDGEDRRRLMIQKEDAAPAGPQRRAQQGRQPGSAHARTAGVFAVTLCVTLGIVLSVSPAAPSQHMQ